MKFDNGLGGKEERMHRLRLQRRFGNTGVSQGVKFLETGNASGFGGNIGCQVPCSRAFSR
jgi:hypothetical protein